MMSDYSIVDNERDFLLAIVRSIGQLLNGMGSASVEVRSAETLCLEIEERLSSERLIPSLLEAEAEERVEVYPDRALGKMFVTKDFTGAVYLTEQNEILYDPSDDGDWMNLSWEVYELILCLAAALAEKRRREGPT